MSLPQANSSPQQNLVPNEASLQDLLNLERKRLKLEFNCHAIATLQAFNKVEQTATATINYQQTAFVLNPQTNSYSPMLTPYPILVDCPVQVIGGGGTQGGCLTFPYAKGDECLVAFNDRDIDNWFSGGTGGAVATNRLHSISDGMIIVGFRSLANVIPNYDTSNVVLRDFAGLAAVGIQCGEAPLALIKTTAGGTLGTQLQKLMTQLTTLNVALQAMATALGTASSFANVQTAGTGFGAATVNVAAQLAAVTSMLGGILA